jgi:hypothetical protein
MTKDGMSFIETLFRSLETQMDRRFDRVDARFDALDARLDQANSRLDRIGGLVNGEMLEERVRKLEGEKLK